MSHENGIRYSKLNRRSRAYYKGLSRNAQLLHLRLLLHPTQSPPGVVHCGRTALAEEVGFSAREINKAMLELIEQGHLLEDTDSLTLWSPEATLADPPANGNVLKGWARTLLTLGRCYVAERIAWAIVESIGQSAREKTGSRFGADEAAQILSDVLGFEPFPERLPELSAEPSRERSAERSGNLPLRVPNPIPNPDPERTGSPDRSPPPSAVTPTEAPTAELRLLPGAPAPEPEPEVPPPAVIAFDGPEEAWAGVLAAVKAGPVGARVLEALDAQTRQALAAIGGSQALRSSREAQLGALQRAFCEAYSDPEVARGSWRARAAPAATRVARAGPGRRRQLELGRGRW